MMFLKRSLPLVLGPIVRGRARKKAHSSLQVGRYVCVCWVGKREEGSRGKVRYIVDPKVRKVE